MEQAIRLQDTGDRYLISIDKTIMKHELVLKLLERLRIEYLIKNADITEDIEILGDEIESGSEKKRI